MTDLSYLVKPESRKEVFSSQLRQLSLLTGEGYVYRNNDGTYSVSTSTVSLHASTHASGGVDALPWGTINGYGLTSARPVASAANLGYLYKGTDDVDGTVWRSNGSSWQVWGIDTASSIAWTNITGKPTTIAGYGITDAYTKDEVDALIVGLQVKASVRVRTTAQITLSGLQTVDTVALSEDDRVLVMNQTDARENGIYLAKSGAWVRSPDANSNGEVKTGMYTWTSDGSAQYKGTGWVLVTPNPVTLGTSDLIFQQFNGSTSISAGTGLTLSGTTLSLTGQALALHNLATNGFIVRTGTDTVSARTLVAPAAGITITNADGIAANPTFALANDLAAVEGLTTFGYTKRTADSVWSTVTSIPWADITSPTTLSGYGITDAQPLNTANLTPIAGLSTAGYARRVSDGSWAIDATIPWGSISGAPGSFTPSAHASTHLAGGSDAIAWATAHGYGNNASRPAASGTNAGYLYYATDTNVLARSNGGTWDTLNPLTATQVAFGSSNGVSTSDSTFTFNSTLQSVGVKYVQFDVTATDPTHVQGCVYWNVTEHTLNLMSEITGSVLQVGQENWVRIVNKTGSTILDGSAVYVSGAQGNRPTGSLALANSPTASDRTLGVANANIANNAEGYVTVFGLVHEFNTSAFTDGDILYVHPTIPGAITNTRPAPPYHAVRIGYALNSTNNGLILVSVDTGTHLDALHDVTITTPAAGNVLRYDGSLWRNNFLSLADIAQSSALTGQVATWSGTAWVPQTPVTGTSGGIYGSSALGIGVDTVHITHTSMDAMIPPMVSITVPASSDVLTSVGIFNRTSTGFDVILSGVTDKAGYIVNWAIPFAGPGSGGIDDGTAIAYALIFG